MVMKTIARTWLKLIGWQALYQAPTSPHGILIVYPHTSNWDFLFGCLWKYSVDLNPKWIAKDSLFKPKALGYLMTQLGGIGISREGNLNLTNKFKEIILSQDNCWLTIAIEGTRSYKPYVHMSYYYIALEADIPVGIAKIDYKKKNISVLTYRKVMPTIEEELEQLKIDFKDVNAKHPHQMGDFKIKTKQENLQ